MAPAKPAPPVNSQYQSVATQNDYDSDPKKLEMKHPPHEVAVRRSLWGTVVAQSFFIAWLAPIVILLLLNFQGYKIGASAWCPNGGCLVDAWNPDTRIPERRTHRFDHHDHDLLGALQFVAKALEVWFGMIAVALVYLVTMRLANRKEGLPIGYLTRPSEFGDITGLFDPLLWTSMRKPSDRQAPRWTIWIFVAMTLAMCALTNLMGPAAAVLVIPSLQWVDAPEYDHQRFGGLNNAVQPTDHGFAMRDQFVDTCDSNDFAIRNYTCTAYDWAMKLDAWAAAWAAAAAEGSYEAVVPQDLLLFTVNESLANRNGQYRDPMIWVPSRQVVALVNDDVSKMQSISRGYDASDLGLREAEFDSYRLYNRSLEVQIQRNGPILGTFPNAWVAKESDALSWTTRIDADRSLQCYADSLALMASSNASQPADKYTQCIQIGPGWGGSTRQASFAISGSYDTNNQTVGSPIGVSIFASDRVAFLPNGTLPTGISPDCIANGTVPDNTACDWNTFFEPSALLANASSHVTTIQMTLPGANDTAIFAINFAAYAGFVNYTIDPSPLTNPMQLVQTQTVPSQHREPIPIHPAWTLAAWSTEDGGTIPANRSTTSMANSVLRSILSDEYNTWAIKDIRSALISVPVMQTLSIIEYETNHDPASGTQMYRTARVYIWAYGINSRTAYVGVTVVCLGILVVLTQAVLGIVDRRPYRSPTQLLVAALEHVPKGEFVGKDEEAEMARVRFLVRDDAGRVGKFSFFGGADQVNY